MADLVWRLQRLMWERDGLPWEDRGLYRSLAAAQVAAPRELAWAARGDIGAASLWSGLNEWGNPCWQAFPVEVQGDG